MIVFTRSWNLKSASAMEQTRISLSSIKKVSIHLLLRFLLVLASSESEELSAEMVREFLLPAAVNRLTPWKM